MSDAPYLEIITPRDGKHPVRFALFDFDGTLSLIREGWQGIMIPYFIEELLKAPNAPAADDAASIVREFVERLTGKQTIYQCMALGEEIERCGGTALDPLEYKREYLRRLWVRIEGRVNGLKDGTLDPEPYILAGGRELLEALKGRGVEMYVASGTDVANVVEECAAVKLDGYFGPHIYGARDDDLTGCSKQMIIARLLEENGLHGSQLVVVGDGYVEIEEAKKVGGIAIGVASDEQNPGGRDEWKRNRLVSAGADAIVPDYSRLPELLAYIFGK